MDNKEIIKDKYNKLADNYDKILSVKKISSKIKLKIHKPNPGLKTKGLFYIFRMIHKKMELIPYDREHWKKHGWLEKKRPWKKD